MTCHFNQLGPYGVYSQNPASTNDCQDFATQTKPSPKPAYNTPNGYTGGVDCGTDPYGSSTPGRALEPPSNQWNPSRTNPGSKPMAVSGIYLAFNFKTSLAQP